MRIGFVLMPGYSSISYVSAVEALLVCNQLMGEEYYRIENACLTGNSSVSSLGNKVTCEHCLDTLGPMDAYFIAGTSPGTYQHEEILHTWLAELDPDSVLAGIATGSYDLARAGLLNGYRAVIHWWKYEEIMSSFKSVVLSTDVYAVDRNRYTCRGGTASLDMMLFLLARQQGMELAQVVAQYFVDERLGNHPRMAPVPLSKRTQAEQPKLAEALALMEANIEEPLTTDDISVHVKISRRQLERLFKKHLDSVPSKYYQQIRLEKARQMLLNSSDSIADIGLSCGFSSGAHFSTAYRSQYGITPSEERRLSQKIVL
ncbi:GlxA family transcriptional regulator [Gynuella sunshinyii]|uniref:GlxA family transcriptional regulator n=1 Tax=Gynuella sunshinyii TaxID=1445505 RepID=UPI000B0B62E5|nr:GlxA family transcriptional regulator [Gynuella sunshinyii]